MTTDIKQSFAHSEVRPYNGVPTLFVNGEPMHGMTATSCAFMDPDVVHDFVAGGVEIMMIWIEIGIECWRGPGQYDWSYAEKRLQYFEENAPDNKWIIRIRLGLLNHWFKHTYPDEVHKPPTDANDTGLSVCNLTSPIWLEHVEQLVRDFTAWLLTTRWASHIIGFMLNAGSSEEWLIFDTHETYAGRYQQVYVRELRRWLEKKYQTVEALRAAWGDEDVTFATANPPTGHLRNGSHIWGPFSLRDPKLERPAIDYYEFLNGTLADAYISICRAAKEAAGTPIICGGFHSYLWWETGVYSYIQEYGHGYIQRLNESPWVDFISDITSYDDRYAGGPSGYLGIPQSINLHNKLHYTEVDLQTTAVMAPEYRDAWAKVDPATIPVMSSEPAIPNRLWRWNYVHCGRDWDEQIAICQRESMHNVTTGTPYWWFDIRCHNYQEPKLLQAMKHLSDIGKQAVHWDRRSISEVAFVLSEDTPMRQAASNGSTLRFELESVHTLLIDLCTRKWGLAGVPFDTYELYDLGHPNFPGDQYKVIIFVNCAYITPKAAAGIKRWQRDGKTLCWTYAAGVMDDERIDPTLGGELVGTRLGWRNQRQHIHVHVDGAEHPLTRGGTALDFWTEGSAGPVFFADDPEALVLGHLTHGGEPALTLRQHPGWQSVYASMLNFGPQFLRNLVAYSGGHVWCDSDDTIYANHSLLTLHTASPGVKTLTLPAPARVTDLLTGEKTPEPVSEITIQMPPYRTHFWRTEYEK